MKKFVKGKAIADQLAHLPLPEFDQVNSDFPDETYFALVEESMWKIYFDGALNKKGRGIGITLISPESIYIKKKEEKLPLL